MSSVTRFNLLCLEEGEQFFEDYAAGLYLPNNNKPISSRKNLSGRLKVASKNLIFEPHAIQHPIMRFPYLYMKSLHMDKAKQHLIIVTSHVCKLKKHNISAPYIFEDILQAEIDGMFVFEPSYSRLDDMCTLINTLYKITKSKTKNTAQQVNELMYFREKDILFDSSWFVDIDEVPKLNAPLNATQHLPLIELRGQMQITSKRIYFQPFHNQSCNPMLKYNINKIEYIYKRRHIMINNALELIIATRKRDNFNNNTLLLSFEDQSERDHVYDLLIKLANYDNNINSVPSLKYVQTQWINGNISNFSYLMFLNQQSGRSFNDLTQYPIFPWILTDYESDTLDLNNLNNYRDLSKPIGALNPKRLHKILSRYKEMPPDERGRKFMYGSHYSSPAYVMYFLVRQFPDYMLRFQNGKYDAPDRLFSSISRTWLSAYNSLTDVKELIPQFYDTDCEVFLLNSKNLNLGIRSDKQEVHHVELPKWANSPKHFIQTLRNALESDYVSSKLHHWIDLIWGFKQRGDQAEKAFNLFYYLTYEGAVDVDSISDKEELKSIQMQINEFGQTPSQLFTASHPQKKHYNKMNSFHSLSLLQLDYKNSTKDKEQKQDLQQASTISVSVSIPVPHWKYLENNSRYVCSTISPHSHRITDLSISSDSRYLFSTSHDSTLSVYNLHKKELIRSIKVSHLALSSCCTPFNFGIIPVCVIGSWDNNIYIYNNNKNKIEQTLKCHNDAVSCLDSSPYGVNSGSWDNTIKIWQFAGNDGIKNKPIISYKIESEARCISNCYLQPNILINGDENGTIYLFDIRSNAKKACCVFAAHQDEITSICWIPNKYEFISCSSDCYMKHWDAANSKLPIKQIATRETLNYVEADNNLLIAAGETGNIRLFNQNQNQFNEFSNYSLKTLNAHSISKMCLTKNGKYIVVGTKQYTNNIQIFETNQLYHHNKSFSSSSPTINYQKSDKQSDKHNKTSSFGSNAFAKLTQSASNLFSYGQKYQK